VVESCSREVATRAESGPDGCTARMVYNHVNVNIKKVNLLEWWKQNANKYLILSILARNYLVIPATLAAIERIFSFSNNIITKLRNRLYLDTVKMVIFLKSWGIKSIEELNAELNNMEEVMEK